MKECYFYLSYRLNRAKQMWYVLTKNACNINAYVDDNKIYKKPF